VGSDAPRLPVAFKGATRLTLPAIEEQLVTHAKQANTASHAKRLQIGIDRDGRDHPRRPALRFTGPRSIPEARRAGR
jgi:hypothetical protein